MKKIRIIAGILAAAVFAPAAGVFPVKEAAAEETLPYQDTSLSFEERAADLVSRMTLSEKAAQTGNSASAISRLGVSKYNYWREGIHGVARQGQATSFPVSLALSNTWDRQLMYDVMDITSTEARGKNNKTDLSYWNPTINMARDPRWGRNEESYGEDPYLTAELGKKAVEGMQGNDEKYLKAISTLKHFAANNIEGERQRGTSIMTEKTLREYYTRAFKDIIESSDPASVMSSYNAETITRSGETIVDYIASSSNKYLLTDLLRRSWGFSGYVVGDCGAFENLYTKPSLRRNLFPDANYEDITPEMTISTAFNAGGDLDCGHAAQAYVKTSAEQGYMSEDTLDLSLYRLFLARMKTGEFDGDDIAYRDITSSVIETDENVAKAEEAAEKSWVLLENKNNTLPIKSDTAKVAVVGSMADKLIIGDYSGEPTKTTTPIDGIKSELAKLNPNVEVQYLSGVLDDEKLFDIKSLTLVMKDGTKTAIDLSKAENVSGMTLTSGKLTDVTPKAAAVIKDVNFANVASVEVEMATGSRIGGTVSIAYGSGGPTVAAINSQATASLDEYAVCSGAYTGEDGGYNGVADMYISASASVQEFSVDAYKTQLDEADYIIAYAATIPKQTGLGTADASESNDRKTIDLPDHESHVQAIADAGDYADKTIVVMSTVGQINVEPFKDNCAAILWTSYNGQTQGEALGKVLTGEVNPSGRLTTTWYSAADLAKMPLGSDRIKDSTIGAEYYYTSYEIAQGDNYPGRTYQYYSGSAVYPFGYGKSYTSFEYSNIAADKTAVDANGTITITADVTNTGSTAGAEVAQLYVTVPGADGVNLPLKQLKGFERIKLNAGEKKTVTFKLNIADVNFYDETAMKNYVVNGEYTAKVAPNADDAGLSVKFNVTGTLSDKIKNVTAVPTGIRLIGAKDGEAVHAANEIDAQASVSLDNDELITDLSELTVTYTSSDESVARVSSDGIVTAGTAEGTATVTVSVTKDGVTETDTFPVVTQIKDMVSSEQTAQYLAELNSAYKSYNALAYTEEDYKTLTDIYENYRTKIEESVIAENNASYLEAALKEMAAVPAKELVITNEDEGKITVSVPYDSAALIAARYDGEGALSSVQITPVTESGDYELSGFSEDETVTLMVWDSVSGMKPLLNAVQHTYNAPVVLNKVLFDFADSGFDSFFSAGGALESGTLENTNGMKMYGFGTWDTDTHSASIDYDGESYTFTRALKGGSGSKTDRCVYFTPQSDGIVTVFFRAAADRKVVIEQNGVTEEKYGDATSGDAVLVAFEREITAGEPVYIYGGGSNKFIYAVMFRTEGEITPETPSTPAPTEEPMPEIVSTEKLEFESYVKTWPDPEAKRVSTSSVEAASGGLLVDNTKNGDIIYMGTRNIENLAGIEVIAGTKESSAAVEFFAVDMTGLDASAMSQTDVNALLTTENSLGKTSLIANSSNWNDLKTCTVRVTAQKSGLCGIFMKCSTGASYCGNFDYLNLMYSAGNTVTTEWNGAEVELMSCGGETRVVQLIGDGVTVDITPETFAESDAADADIKMNSILAVDDQLYIGCDGGLLITMTSCSKCSTVKKVCDFDIKSLEYGEDGITVTNGSETAVISLADARGYTISRETALEMAGGGALLVDVRTAEEFAEDAWEGAVNVPLDTFADWIENQPSEQTIVVYCSTGTRAAQAVSIAIEKGHTKIYAVK